LVIAVLVYLWPLIFERRSQEEPTLAAAWTHAEELRQSNEHQRYQADPAIQAFTEQRRRDIASGLPTEEKPLGIVVHWVGTRSAWARWQAAQMHLDVGHRQILHVTESYVLILLQEGRLPTRGERNGNPNAVEFISPNWWGNFQFTLVADPLQIYKAAIAPRHGVDATAFPMYATVMCDWRKVLTIFPEKDEGLDARTTLLRGEV
jgi:hypothetical protein